MLLCELSQYHVCIALADAASRKITQLSYYELRNILEPEKLHDVMRAENVDVRNMNRVVVSNAVKDVVLVPASYFSEDSGRRFYTSGFGSTPDTFFYDQIPEYNVVLVHAFPQAIMDSLKSLQGTEAMHFYSCQLRTDAGFESESQITVHFTSKEIHIIAKREQQLKIAQTYYYATPLDVVYYLLLICQEYNFSQTKTVVVLSGLVSEDSAMYNELHQYFSALCLWKPPSKTILQGDHPHHFFSSMYNLAACVL